VISFPALAKAVAKEQSTHVSPFELGSAGYCLELVSESPNVNTAAPSSTTSFNRKPPEPDKAGKPPRLFSQPGKENRNVNVAKNVHTASTLPIAESLAEMGRIAINRAAVISATPMMLEVA
jgi:hypothetical protein